MVGSSGSGQILTTAHLRGCIHARIGFPWWGSTDGEGRCRSASDHHDAPAASRPRSAGAAGRPAPGAGQHPAAGLARGAPGRRPRRRAGTRAARAPRPTPTTPRPASWRRPPAPRSGSPWAPPWNRPCSPACNGCCRICASCPPPTRQIARPSDVRDDAHGTWSARRTRARPPRLARSASWPPTRPRGWPTPWAGSIPTAPPTTPNGWPCCRRELADLDRELAATLAPVRGGELLVMHPAFGWFAERYGLIQTAVEQGGLLAEPPPPRRDPRPRPRPRRAHALPAAADLPGPGPDRGPRGRPHGGRAGSAGPRLRGEPARHGGGDARRADTGDAGGRAVSAAPVIRVRDLDFAYGRQRVAAGRALRRQRPGFRLGHRAQRRRQVDPVEADARPALAAAGHGRGVRRPAVAGAAESYLGKK